jgi:putative membrane protein
MDMIGMMNQMMGAWGMGMLLNFGIGVLFLALLIVGIVAGLKWVFGQGTPGLQNPRESALDILKKRYARGDLTKEEREVKKWDIA